MKALAKNLIKFFASFWEIHENLVPDPNAKGRWRLFYGIHKGDSWSREVVSDYYATEQEARDAYQKAKNYHAHYGYFIWFAYLYNPDGRKRIIDTGVAYKKPY